MTGVTGVTMRQVLAWRLRRQFLDGGTPAENAVRVADRLCGVQAQVASSAVLAVSVRTGRPAAAEIDTALRTDRSLVKMWAARGTLHLLTPRDAALHCGLLGETRNWQQAAWLRNFGVTAQDMDAVLGGIAELLDGRVLTREELVAELVEHTGSPHLAEALQSGWGALLKPAAYSGLLCHGPSSGNRVTFTSPSSWLPGWRPVPPEEAGPEVVRRYLAAYGPATRNDVLNWLRRGVKVSPAKTWFAALGDELVTVEVDGAPASMLAEHLDELAGAQPAASSVRLLGAFDQYVIAVDRSLIPAEHRAKVSRTAGWISPVVLHQGRIAGVWNLDGGRLAVELFGKVPKRALAAEANRVTELLGVAARLAVAP